MSGILTFQIRIKKSLDYGKREFGEVDVAVGPDYALCSINLINGKLVDFESYEQILTILGQISREHPKTLILPGTTPKRVGEGLMGHVCPVFLGGRLEKELYKETDCGESNTARDNELEYKKGDNSQNFVNYNKKKISVEICSDHGKQKIDNGTFLEVIMAHDLFGGFHIGVLNDNFDRYALVCNSLRRIDDHVKKPTLVECFEFNRSNDPKLRIVEPVLENKDFKGYNLNEN